MPTNLLEKLCQRYYLPKLCEIIPILTKWTNNYVFPNQWDKSQHILPTQTFERNIIV